MIVIPMEVIASNPTVEMEVTATEPLIEFDVEVVFREISDPYEGRYTVTPSPETQMLETNGLVMTDNVVINPIPSNYGLITWDGSIITVS